MKSENEKMKNVKMNLNRIMSPVQVSNGRLIPSV